MYIIYILLWLAIIVSPALFTLLYVNQKKKHKRQLWVAWASYIFFVLIHFSIASDDDERIEAAEWLVLNFSSCVSYMENVEDMTTCLEELADNAEIYSEQYEE